MAGQSRSVGGIRCVEHNLAILAGTSREVRSLLPGNGSCRGSMCSNWPLCPSGLSGSRTPPELRTVQQLASVCAPPGG